MVAKDFTHFVLEFMCPNGLKGFNDLKNHDSRFSYSNRMFSCSNEMNGSNGMFSGSNEMIECFLFK